MLGLNIPDRFHTCRSRRWSPLLPRTRRSSVSVATTQSLVKVLMIAWSFPPEAEVGALRTARFCRYLPEFGIEPIVLTAELSFYKDRDAPWPIPMGLRVERTHVMPTPLDWYARWRKRGAQKPSVSGTGNSAK